MCASLMSIARGVWHLLHLPGRQPSTPDQDTAISELTSADAAVVVVGEKAYAEGPRDCSPALIDADSRA